MSKYYEDDTGGYTSSRERDYGTNHKSSERVSQHNSGYAGSNSNERNKKQIYEYNSAERVGRYVKIID